jgi:hypothetical protein
VAALGVFAVFGTVHSPVKADAPPKAEILVIHATKCDKKSVDPAIGEPPPSAMGFDCLKLVEKKVIPLPIGQANTTPLPNGRTFQLVHTERVGNRYKVTASINSADGKGFTKLADITADPNKQFNVGGWMYQGGAIVLTIKIVP